MCGIFGFSGLVDEDKRPYFEAFITALAVETQVRGLHATGLAAYLGKHRAYVAKGPVKAEEFVRSGQWAKAISGAKSMIGHCRWATHGSPSNNVNNHPFETDRLALIHNGVIGDYKRIADMHGLSLKSECDSEIILRVVAKGAGRKTDVRAGLDLWQRATAKVSADYAIAVLDKYTGAIRLLRDDGRPCAVIKIPSLNIVAFASTKEIINKAFEAMVRACGTDDKAAAELIENAECWDLKLHRVYVLDFSTMEVEHEEVYAPPVEKVTWGAWDNRDSGGKRHGSIWDRPIADDDEFAQCPNCGGVMSHDASCSLR